MHHPSLSAAALPGPPPFLLFSPVRPAPLSGNTPDLWLVIGLLLLFVLAGSGILFLLTAGLARREGRLLAALERELTAAPPPKAPVHRTLPSPKSPWP